MTILEDVMEIAEELRLNAVVIRGMALPAYKVVRTTLDLDLCISFLEQKAIFDFLKNLGKRGYRTKQNPNHS